MAPRIGRPSGFLPRLPSRLPPPSSVHDGVSLLRQVLLWLPPSFLRYLWHCLSRNRYRRMCRPPAGREWECVRPGGAAGSTTVRGPQWGRGCPRLACRAPQSRPPRNADAEPTLVLGGASSGSSAGVFALLPCACPSLAHVTGALTAVIRCPDGSRHGQTGGVAWRRGGVYDSLPQHRRAALMSFSPLRAPAAASPTSGQVDTTPDHRGFVPARGCPRLAGLAGRGRQGSRVFLGVIARLVVGEWGRRCGCPTAAGGFAPGPRSR